MHQFRQNHGQDPELFFGTHLAAFSINPDRFDATGLQQSLVLPLCAIIRMNPNGIALYAPLDNRRVWSTLATKGKRGINNVVADLL